MTPEGRIKAKVNAAIEKYAGKDCYRFMPVQNGMGAPGLDYYLCLRGHFLAVETKAPGRDLTARQKTTKEYIEHAGGTVLVVDGDDDIAVLIHLLQHENWTHERSDWCDRKDLPAAQASWTSEQYLCSKLKAQAARAPAGRDHGTSGKEPGR